MSSIDKKIQADGEHSKERGVTVAVNTQAGALVFDDNTAEERVQLTHTSGWTQGANRSTSFKFSPNNDQEQVLGDKYSTTKGDSYSQTQGMCEVRPFGDFTLIAGSEKFFTEPIADNWIEAQKDLAVAKTGGELAIGGVGNNTNIAFPKIGESSSIGTVEGGSFQSNPAQENIQNLLEKKGGELAAIEKEMGVGGSAKIMAAKHIHLHAGPKPIINDSGLIVANGRAVNNHIDFVRPNAVKNSTGTTLYESKDTSSAVPFGDISLVAGTKLIGEAGSGGINFKSSGNSSFTSTGRTTIGGAEVAIGGSTSSNVGRVSIQADKDVFIQSQDMIGLNADTIFTDMNQSFAVSAPKFTTEATNCTTFITPITLFTGDVHIIGDLFVEGCILANGDITAGGAGGVSLLKHTHPQNNGNDAGGDVNSQKPDREDA